MWTVTGTNAEAYFGEHAEYAFAIWMERNEKELLDVRARGFDKYRPPNDFRETSRKHWDRRFEEEKRRREKRLSDGGFP